MGTEAAVAFLLNKMDVLVSREYELLAGIHKAVEELRREFQTIKAFLAEEDAAGDKQVQVWIGQVRELAYDIEDALDVYTSHTAAQCHSHLPEFLHVPKRRAVAVLVEEINGKLERVRQSRDRYSQLRASPTQETSSFTDYFDRVAPLFDTEPVGIEEVLTELTNWVKLEEPRLKVLFVVGMGGLGKTLVAKQIYEAEGGSFDCWGWIQGSRSLSKEQVLRTLLKELLQSGTREEPPIPERMTVVQLMKELTGFLKHRKYMIVLDDLWSRELWESIKCALPTDQHSRIMITTRRGDIAHFCCYDQSTSVHSLQPLASRASRELFFKMAFPSGDHSHPGLLEWAGKLLAQCEGLPLGILTIGKHVSRMEQTAHAWRQMYDCLGSAMQNGGPLSSMTLVLSASYSDLPYYLKHCLLYFTTFPEDHSVRRRRLIRMWVSEGLVMQETGKTPEEVGSHYLEQLMQRNLVLADQVDFDGRPKTCRLHRILHKIILSISRQENFCRASTEAEVSDRARRLSVTTENTRILTGKSFPCARSFFLFGISPDLSILSSFRILKVLDLQGASQLDKFPAQILNLILLRYLSLRSTRVKKLPGSIWKLQNLETLDLKHTLVTAVPGKMFRLSKLRHLLIYHHSTVMVYASVDSVQGFGACSISIGKLISLQKLTCIKADKDVLVALRNLTNLKKLGILELREDDGRHLCYSIEMMHTLQTLNVAARKDEVLDLSALRKPMRMLQRLYLNGKLRKLPGWISSLHDLVRVGLRWSKLDESPIDVLQDLPNLMEVQLLDAYTGKQLVFGAGKFQSLKVLEVEGLEFLEQVLIEGGSLQRLQTLTLRRCRMVQEFPRGVGELIQLKELHLYGMPECLVKQIEYGGGFRPLVQHIPLVCAYSLDGGGIWQSREV